MLVAQVRVSLHHLQRLVSENSGNFRRRRAAHRKVARRRVAQVVKAKILDARRFERRIPEGIEPQRALLLGWRFRESRQEAISRRRAAMPGVPSTA